MTGIAATGAREIYKRLCTLEGLWTTEAGNRQAHQVRYTCHASGFALLEHWLLGPKADALTIYHVGETGLVATHYCPHQNRVELRLEDCDPADGGWVFGACGAPDPDLPAQERQASFQLTLLSVDMFRRSERYCVGGKSNESAWTYTRAAKGQA